MNPLKKNLCKSAFVFLALFSLTGCGTTPENSGSALNELCPQDHILNLYVKTTDANTDAGTYSAGLAYYVNSDNNTAAVAIGTCSDTAIVLPSSFNTLPVVGIMESGFANTTSYTAITLPSSLTMIGSQAFAGSALTTIEIPASVTALNPSTFLNNAALLSVSFAGTSSCTSVGSHCFAGAYSLNDISLPNTITEIGIGAFMGCYSLTTMFLPTGLLTLRSFAFQDCTKLALLHFSSGITTCEEYVFKGCPSNTTALMAFASSSALPSGFVATWARRDYYYNINVQYGYGDISILGGWAFSDNVVNNVHKITIVYYSGSLPSTNEDGSNNYGSVDLVIPATLYRSSTTYLVVGIAPYAFQGHFELRSIRFYSLAGESDGHQTYASNLSYLTLIDQYAFYDCRYLQSLDFTSSSVLETIGNYAFERAAGYQNLLTVNSLVIPASVISIGNYAFSFFKYLDTLTFATGSVLKTIGASAFNSCGRSALNPAATGSTADDTADSGYKSNVCSYAPVCDLVFPNTLTSIGNNAFEYCIFIRSITFSENSDTSVKLTIGDYAFQSITFLQGLTFSHNVTTLNQYCFTGYNGVNNTLPQFPTLFYVLIPNSITTVKYPPFPQRTRLTLCFESSATPNSKFFTDNTTPDGAGGASNLSHGLSGIPAVDYTNVGTTSTQRKVIESNISGYGHFYFLQTAAGSSTVSLIRNCYSNLASDVNVVVPRYLNSDGSLGTASSYTYQVTAIGDSAFFSSYSGGSYALQSVKIPNSVTSIGAMSFAQCLSLNNVAYYSDSPSSSTANSLPSALTNLGDFAFGGCTSLATLALPGTITSFGQGVFMYANALSTITRSGSSTSIQVVNGIVFNSSYTTLLEVSSGLTVATSFPNGVFTVRDATTAIAPYAAAEVRTFTSLSLPYTLTSIGEHAFDNLNGTSASLTSVSFYQGASGLSAPSLTSIGDYAFQYRNKITSVTLPAALTSIGNYAFSSCSAISTFNSGTAKVLDLSACTALTTLGKFAFSGNTTCTTAVVGTSTNANQYLSLDSGAFSGCTKITSFVLPAGVGVTNSARTGSYVFASCSALPLLSAYVANGTSGIFLSCSGREYDSKVANADGNGTLLAGWNNRTSTTTLLFGCYSAADPSGNPATNSARWTSGFYYWRYVSGVPKFW